MMKLSLAVVATAAAAGGGATVAAEEVCAARADAKHPSWCTACPDGYGLNTLSHKCKKILDGSCVAGSCDGSGPGQTSAGKYIFDDTGDVYTGQWRDVGDSKVFAIDKSTASTESPFGIFHGVGVFQWSSGGRYEGEYSNGNKHGVGVFTWANGDSYAGAWINDEEHGAGVFSTQGNAKVYTGAWENGQRHGRGLSAILSFDRETNMAVHEEYAGDWRQGLKQGSGVFSGADGVQYFGEYANDFMHGYGIATAPNGTSYAGAYANDLKHGCGRLQRAGPSPNIDEGQWEKNVLVKPCETPRCCQDAVEKAEAAQELARQTERVARGGQRRHGLKKQVQASEKASAAQLLATQVQATPPSSTKTPAAKSTSPSRSSTSTKPAKDPARVQQAPSTQPDVAPDAEQTEHFDFFGWVALLSRVYAIAYAVEFFFLRKSSGKQ